MTVDVSRGQDVTALLRAIEQKHKRLDVVVNNAGINVRTDFRHMTDADWARLREVNLDGIIRIARDAFPLLRASGRASLINLASIMGHRGMRTLAAYGATKGAISALTRGLAVEYAPFGIRVNALAPGFIETALTERVLRIEAFSKALLEQTPLRRFGTSEDVANAALFFASDESAFITGAELAIDGGMQATLVASRIVRSPFTSSPAESGRKRMHMSFRVRWREWLARWYRLHPNPAAPGRAGDELRCRRRFRR